MKQKIKPKCLYCSYQGRRFLTLPALRTFAVGSFTQSSGIVNAAFEELKVQYASERQKESIIFCPKCYRTQDNREIEYFNRTILRKEKERRKISISKSFRIPV